MLYITTVATHSERYLPVLEKQVSDKGINLTKLAFGKKYYGHEMKDKELLKFLSQREGDPVKEKEEKKITSLDEKNSNFSSGNENENEGKRGNYLLADDDIIVFLDGFDTLCLAPVDEIVSKFKKMDKKLVISVENVGFLSFIHSAIFNRVRGKYINTGLFMGYAGFLRQFLTHMYQYNTHKYSNQKTWSDFIYKNSWRHMNADDIGLDVDGELFLNYSFTVRDTYIMKEGRVLCNGKKPAFMQGNGCADLNYVIEKSGYKKENINTGKMWKNQMLYNWKALFVLYSPILNLYAYLVILLLVIFVYILYGYWKKWKLSRIPKI